jgi:hypothetical protein
MLIEIFVFVIHPPIMVDASFTIGSDNTIIQTYCLDEILTSFSVLRLYFALRVLPQFTTLATDRARRICDLNGFEPDFLFFLKITLKEKPFILLTFCLTLFTLTFGLVVQIFERGIFKEGKFD